MRKMLVLIFVLFGCGGGGGNSGNTSSNDVPFYAGVWRGELVASSDECNILPILGIPSDYQVVHTINQDGERVVLDVLGGATFAGSINQTNDGFVVTTPSTSSNGCTEQDVIMYGAIENGNQAPVVAELAATCGSTECNVVYNGVTTRDP